MANTVTIRASKTPQQVHDEITKHTVDKTVKIMQRVGELSTNDSRGKHDWITQTGNLASSIGYIITVGKNVLQSVFKGDKATGSDKGLALARKVAANQNQILNLLALRGWNMHYHLKQRVTMF